MFLGPRKTGRRACLCICVIIYSKRFQAKGGCGLGMRLTLELLGDVTLAFPLLTLTVASFLLHWPPGQYPPPAVAGWAVTGSSSHRHGGTPHSPGTMVTVTVDTQVTQPSHVP